MPFFLSSDNLPDDVIERQHDIDRSVFGLCSSCIHLRLFADRNYLPFSFLLCVCLSGGGRKNGEIKLIRLREVFRRVILTFESDE